MLAILRECCLLQDTIHWPLLALRTMETQCIDSDPVYIRKWLCWPQQKDSHLLFEPNHYQTNMVCKVYWLCARVYAHVQYVLIVTSVCARTTNICILFPVGPVISVLLSWLVKCCAPMMKWQALLLSFATYSMAMIPKGVCIPTVENMLFCFIF